MLRKQHLKKLNYRVQLLCEVQRITFLQPFLVYFFGGKNFFLIAHFVSHSFGKLYLWI